MKTVIGKFAEATIFTEDVEKYACDQLQMICDNPVAEGSVIRVMPDVHPGVVGTIGLTMTVGKRIMPNLLGVDIGCGVSCVKLKEKRFEPGRLDRIIRERVPSGFGIRDRVHKMAEQFDPDGLHCGSHIREQKAFLSLGTLGGGNHFIEVDKDEEGALYLMVHTGSRYLGKEVTEYYLEAGSKELKARGEALPYPLTWLEGPLYRQYIEDVKVVQEFAALNRQIILEEIVKGMKWKVMEQFSSVHNYVDTVEIGGKEELLLRKGAISAKQGERVIIPVNMRDGVVLGLGKGNEQWNQSAPHGSGRAIRRDEVKNRYTVSAFKKEMKDIYCSCVGPDTLDEAPFAYRTMEQLLSGISETVEVTRILQPVYNFKAGKKA